MERRRLGNSGLFISRLGLGTMTWGTQNSEAEGHAQMDMALSQGVNFWDTAEMYPVNPVSKETAGRTESIIGTWFAARGGRARVVLATNIAETSLTVPRVTAVVDSGLVKQLWS